MQVILRIKYLRLMRRTYDESQTEREQREWQEENWEGGWMWLNTPDLDDEEQIDEDVYALIENETGYVVDDIQYEIEHPNPATVKVAVEFEVPLSKLDADLHHAQMVDVVRTTKDALRSAGFEIRDDKDTIHAHIIPARPAEL